jgi:surface antigen
MIDASSLPRLVLPLMLAAALLAGCSTTPSSEGLPKAAPAVSGAFLGSRIGQSLGAEGLSKASAAQSEAVSTGVTAEWRQSGRAYGSVEPGPIYTDAGGTCRRYTHTITVEGRVQTGSGTACRNAEGGWDVVD